MKMEQRKLSDQANTLVDLSKVRHTHTHIKGRLVAVTRTLNAFAPQNVPQHSCVSTLTYSLVWLCVS